MRTEGELLMTTLYLVMYAGVYVPIYGGRE